MSLDYKLTDIEDYEEKCWGCETRGEDYMNMKTEVLIFATMVIDLGEITEKNCIEFYTRMMMYSMINGCYDSITLEDVKAHIGLKTNVPDKTKAKWNRRFGLMARDRVELTMRWKEREESKGGEE